MALALTLAAAAAAPAAPQTGQAGGAPPTGDQPPVAKGFADRISVAWVLVPAVVRTRAGYVNGLGRDDFRLAVDGRPVPVESFDSGADAPVSLVFLQDLSGSMAGGGKIDASRDALAYLLERAGADDEVAVASFAGGRLAVDVPFTRDRGAIAEAMALWDPYGTTALHDAVAWIPEISDEGRHPKRAVVLLTDGIDNASTIAPAEARETVRNARLPVYVLGLGGRPGAAAEPGSFARLLEQLARATGGRYFAVAGPEEAAAAVAALLDELRAQYVLGFAAAAEPREYRRLEVRVRGRGREVLHRAGYTGGAPAAWNGGD